MAFVNLFILTLIILKFAFFLKLIGEKQLYFSDFKEVLKHHKNRFEHAIDELSKVSI
jgi:hypothetical protein